MSVVKLDPAAGHDSSETTPAISRADSRMQGSDIKIGGAAGIRVRTRYFPVGYYQIHSDVSVNFQMNRWLNWMGTESASALVEMQLVATRIHTYDDFVREFMDLARRAEAEGQLRKETFYVRGAEFLCCQTCRRRRLLGSGSCALLVNGTAFPMLTAITSRISTACFQATSLSPRAKQCAARSSSTVVSTAT